MLSALAQARALAGLAWRNDTSWPGSHTPSWRVPPYRPGVDPLTLPVAPFCCGGTVGDVSGGVVAAVGTTDGVNGLAPGAFLGARMISPSDLLLLLSTRAAAMMATTTTTAPISSGVRLWDWRPGPDISAGGGYTGGVGGYGGGVDGGGGAYDGVGGTGVGMSVGPSVAPARSMSSGPRVAPCGGAGRALEALTRAAFHASPSAGRWLGSNARPRLMSSATGAGTSGRRTRTSAGVSVSWARSTCPAESKGKGGSPTSSSCRITAAAYTSLARSAWPCACSGAM